MQLEAPAGGMQVRVCHLRLQLQSQSRVKIIFKCNPARCSCSVHCASILDAECIRRFVVPTCTERISATPFVVLTLPRLLQTWPVSQSSNKAASCWRPNHVKHWRHLP
jgi:hypothetical protein